MRRGTEQEKGTTRLCGLCKHRGEIATGKYVLYTGAVSGQCTRKLYCVE